MSTTGEPERRTARIYDDDGRTVLPKKAREELGVDKGDEVAYIIASGSVQIVKSEDE